MKTLKTLAVLLVLTIVGCSQEPAYYSKFETRTLPDGNVYISVPRDGNFWVTSKDSVQIYIDNH